MPIKPAGRRGLGRTIGRRLSTGTRKVRPLFERRHNGRIKAERAVACNLGEVLNLSSGGMRVHAARRLRGRHKVELWSATASVQVWADVKWAKRDGLRRFDVGLEFLDVTPEIAAQLARFASVG